MIVIIGHLLMYDFGLGIGRLAPIAPTGVDLFFVLSGFLITGILWRNRSEERYFLNFYARRALRIWPLYILLILFLFVAAERWIPTLRPPPGTHWQVFALYLQNFWYRNPDGMGMVLAVTWSLAIEEQFYFDLASWGFQVVEDRRFGNPGYRNCNCSVCTLVPRAKRLREPLVPFRRNRDGIIVGVVDCNSKS